MADVAVRYSATIKDGLGTTASTVAYGNIVDTTTLAGLATAQGAWVAALDGVTDGVITGSTATLVFPGLATDKGAGAGLPAPSSRVEQTGVVNFKNATTAHRWGFVIPALADAKIALGKLDLADAAVITLNTLLTGGTFTNPYLQILTGVRDALLTFREHRKQLSRSSAE